MFLQSVLCNTSGKEPQINSWHAIAVAKMCQRNKAWWIGKWRHFWGLLSSPWQPGPCKKAASHAGAAHESSCTVLAWCLHAGLSSPWPAHEEMPKWKCPVPDTWDRLFLFSMDPMKCPMCQPHPHLTPLQRRAPLVPPSYTATFSSHPKQLPPLKQLNQAVIFLNSNNQGPLRGCFFPPPLCHPDRSLSDHVINEIPKKNKHLHFSPSSPLPRPQISGMLLVHLAFADYVKIYQTYTALLFHENFKLLFLGSIQALPHSVIKGLKSAVLE